MKIRPAIVNIRAACAGRGLELAQVDDKKRPWALTDAGVVVGQYADLKGVASALEARRPLDIRRHAYHTRNLTA